MQSLLVYVLVYIRNYVPLPIAVHVIIARASYALRVSVHLTPMQ